MSSLRFVVAVALPLALPNAAQAGAIEDIRNVDWVSLRDLTSEAFSAAFSDYSSQGFRMIDVDAVKDGSKVRYSMVWQKNTDDRGWEERRDMTSSSFTANHETFTDERLRLHDFESYRSGNDNLFAGIWVENTEGLTWAFRRGMTDAEFGDFGAAQSAAGRRPVDIEIYETDEGRRFAGLWYSNPDDLDWIQIRNMTRSKYEDELDEQTADGLRLIDFESYEGSSEQLYAAIWESKPEGISFAVRSNLTDLQYANVFRQNVDKGYRLVDFERYDTRDGDRYAGVWIENNSRFDYDRKGTLDGLLANYRAANNVPGVSVAVIRDGTVIYRAGSGFADVRDETVAHGGTVYNSGSVAKIFGGTLAAKLEDEGHLHDGTAVNLDLSDTTRTYLPALPEHHTQRVEQLLAHIGCVPHYDTNPAIPNQTKHYENSVEAVKSIWDKGLIKGCTIGQDLNYSTPDLVFVAAVLERATGRPADRLVRNELNEAYALSSLRVQFADKKLPDNYDRAVPYKDNNNKGHYQDNSWKMLGGGLEMNVVDLARFGWKVLNGDIVRPAARDNRLWVPVKPGCGNSSSGACHYGLAWEVTRAGGRRVAEHGGAWTGARAHLRVYRDDGLVVAAMANRDEHDIDDLVGDLADAVLAP